MYNDSRAQIFDVVRGRNDIHSIQLMAQLAGILITNVQVMITQQ